MQTNHTSGNWYLTETATQDGQPLFTIESELTELARLTQWPGHKSETIANARLLASAPLLLDALSDMLGMFGDHEQYDEDSAQSIKQARAAIGAARGYLQS